MKGYPHLVNVMRPTEARGAVGEAQGQDDPWRKDVPCSIDPLIANEAERVHSTWPSVTQKVEFYADPARQVTPNMYLIVTSQGKKLKANGSEEERFLKIVGVIDKHENGVLTVCFCEEEL